MTIVPTSGGRRLHSDDPVTVHARGFDGLPARIAFPELEGGFQVDVPGRGLLHFEAFELEPRPIAIPEDFYPPLRRSRSLISGGD